MPLIYCLHTRLKNIIFCQLKWIANLASLFRQRTFHYVSCRAFLERSREEKYFFYFVDLLPVLIPTYMRNLKIICQREVCKIDKRLGLFIKALKNMTPEKMGNVIYLFKFEILATNIE